MSPQFRFSKPVYLDLYLPSQEFPFKVSLLECWRCVVEADKKPDQDTRWGHIQAFIAEKCNITTEQLAEFEIWEGTAREFRDFTIDEMKKYEDGVKKKYAETASLQPTTLDSEQSADEQDSSSLPG